LHLHWNVPRRFASARCRSVGGWARARVRLRCCRCDASARRVRRPPPQTTSREGGGEGGGGGKREIEIRSIGCAVCAGGSTVGLGQSVRFVWLFRLVLRPESHEQTNRQTDEDDKWTDAESQPAPRQRRSTDNIRRAHTGTQHAGTTHASEPTTTLCCAAERKLRSETQELFELRI
jgi:hypothetical protein